jgi:hypothetical protein
LAKTPEDKELQGHLAKAIRELELAHDVCFKFSKTAQEKVRRNPAAIDNTLRYEIRKAEETTRTLRGMIVSVERIGHLSPNFDLTDPDFIPESQKYAIAAEKRKKEREKLEQEPKSPRQYVIDEE